MELILTAVICLCIGFAMGIFVDRNFVSSFSGAILKVGDVEIRSHNSADLPILAHSAGEIIREQRQFCEAVK